VTLFLSRDLHGNPADEKLENERAWGEGIFEGESGEYDYQTIDHLWSRRFIFQRMFLSLLHLSKKSEKVLMVAIREPR
jgi:hypothetical protein